MPQAIAAAAAWVATAATAVTATLGITSTVGSALAVYSTVQAVTSVALSVGAQVGLSALMSPKVGKSGGGGSQVDFQSNPDSGVPYLVGETWTAGVYVYNTVGEAKNRNLLFCSVVSGAGPLEGFVGLKADKTSVSFGGLQQATTPPYTNRMWLNTQLGVQSQVAFGPPNTTDAGVLAEWTTAHTLPGLAAYWYVLGYDQTAYAAGTPAPLTGWKGVKVYDPRLDSTYPGGSGSHRWNDETTWGYSANPWLHALAWCIGRKHNGKRVFGLGCDITGIDVGAYVEAANVADANAWTLGGVVYSTDSKWEVLKAFCQAGGGKPIPLGAKVSCLVNAPRVSIATLTGADFEGDPTITAVQTQRARINTVVSRYRSPDHDYEIVPNEPLVIDAYVAEDGGRRRTKEIEFPLVQDATQAMQLGAYAAANSREFGPNILPVTPAKGWALKPGDCITINEPEFGLNGQKMLVCERDRGLTTASRTLTCVSETDGKHDYCLGRAGAPPPISGLTGVDLVPEAPAVGAWLIAAGASGDYGSPTLVVTGAVDDPNARWVNVEYRLTGATSWTTWPGGGAGATRFEVTGLKPATAYQVAVSYTSVLNVIGERRVLASTTTGDLPGDPDDTTPPAAPTSLTANGLAGGVRLNWNNPADADLNRIEVWRNTTNNSGTASKIAGASATPGGAGQFTDMSATAGTTLYYWLKAVDASGNASGFSSVASAAATAVDTTPPAAPTGLTATAGFQSISLVWTNPADADLNKVEIWRNTVNNSGTATKIATVATTASGNNKYLDGSLGNGATYYYWTKALDTSGNVSGFSAVATATTVSIDPGDLGTAIAFGAPTGFSAGSSLSTNTDGAQVITVTASWTAIADSRLSFYEVGVTEAGGSEVVFPVSGTAFSAKGRANVSYSLRVRGVDRNGNRTTWATASAFTSTRDTGAPSAPTGASATAGITNVAIKWTNPSAADLDKVEVWFNTANTTVGGTKLGTATVQPSTPGSWFHNGATSGTTYYYWLIAVDTSGNASAATAIFSATAAKATSADLIVDAVIANTVMASVTNTNVLNANVLQSGSQAPAGLLIGTSGFTLGTIGGYAEDPAARINTKTTLVGPGKIQLFGASTLSNWLHGSDQTKIDGGAVFANSLSVNKVNIGARGLTTTGLQFTQNSPSANSVAWTSGTISYVNDAGTATTASISSGSAAWSSGIVYLYWTQGGSSLSTTTSAATANGANNVVLATYAGGASLNVTYGQTIIDQDTLKTRSITALNLAIGTITFNEIAGATIKAANMVLGELTTDYFAPQSLVSAGINDFVPASPGLNLPVGGSSYGNCGSLTITCKYAGGSDGTVVHMHLYIDCVNLESGHSVGVYADVVSSSGVIGVYTGGSFPINPVNSAFLSTPVYARIQYNGPVTFIAGAYAVGDGAGGTGAQVYCRRCKLMPVAVFKG